MPQRQPVQKRFRTAESCGPMSIQSREFLHIFPAEKIIRIHIIFHQFITVGGHQQRMIRIFFQYLIVKTVRTDQRFGKLSLKEPQMEHAFLVKGKIHHAGLFHGFQTVIADHGESIPEILSQHSAGEPAFRNVFSRFLRKDKFFPAEFQLQIFLLPGGYFLRHGVEIIQCFQELRGISGLTQGIFFFFRDQRIKFRRIGFIQTLYRSQRRHGFPVLFGQFPHQLFRRLQQHRRKLRQILKSPRIRLPATDPRGALPIKIHIHDIIRNH